MANKDLYYIQERADGDRVIKVVSLSSSGAIFSIDENGEIFPTENLDASIQLRRDTELNLSEVVLAEGELAYATDTEIVFIGDGVTSGGNRISGGVFESGTGLGSVQPVERVDNVLSGDYSVVLSGQCNTVSGDNSSVIGDDNTISDYNNISFGSLNTIESPNNFIAGNSNTVVNGGSGVIISNANSVSGETNTIVGGCCHTINGRSNSVFGGCSNEICGDAVFTFGSTIVGGNSDKIIDSPSSFIGGGTVNQITGSLASVIGGGDSNHICNAPKSTISGGSGAVTTMFGESARASCFFQSPGDAQISDLILRNNTSVSNSVNLFLDGIDKEMVIPENASWIFQIDVVGRNADDVESAGYKFEGVIERSALSTLIVQNNKTVVVEDNANWDCNISVPSDGVVRITADVEVGQVDVYWVAHVRLVQVIAPTLGCCC